MAMELASKKYLFYYEVSALDNYNIEKTFNKLLKDIHVLKRD